VFVSPFRSNVEQETNKQTNNKHDNDECWMDGGVVVGGGSVGGGSARLSSLSNCPKPLSYQNDLKHPELPVFKKNFEFESIDWVSGCNQLR